jgi:predicted enzyme related to lactoylglutathione lyase
MSNAVGWFEIYVQDMKRAKAFYEGVLGVKLQQQPDPGFEYWMFPMEQEGKGAAGALAKYEGFPSGKNSVLVYFTCEDCAVEEARVKKLGGKVEKPKQSIGQYGFISLVYDTEGNMIGLHSRK